MKAKIKEKLVWGTHVNPEVYDLMIKYSAKQLDNLANSIILAYDSDTSSKRITEKHFNTAIVNMLMGDEDE
jgi:hypothetical protein|tara:strand:- start:1880 stop:2092 length:213 start_codon:yes stop_codon:yes gene_type:complete